MRLSPVPDRPHPVPTTKVLPLVSCVTLGKFLPSRNLKPQFLPLENGDNSCTYLWVIGGDNEAMTPVRDLAQPLAHGRLKSQWLFLQGGLVLGLEGQVLKWM